MAVVGRLWKQSHGERSRAIASVPSDGWTAPLLSFAWSFALAVIQLAPTDVANSLMGTTDLDNGDFWILQEADAPLAMSAAAFLSAFGAGYLLLALKTMLVHRRRAVMSAPAHSRLAHAQQITPEAPTASLVSHPTTHIVRPERSTCCNTEARLWGSKTLRRCASALVSALDNPIVALPKLVLQTTVLLRYLREGFPPSTTFSYAALLAVNWFISAYSSTREGTERRSNNVQLFNSFDLFFAVLAPLQILIYAYSNFDFDCAEFATRVETLNPGNFDRIAQLFADPVEVAAFRTAFKSLQLTSVWGLIVKAALNVLAIRKLSLTLATRNATLANPLMPRQPRRWRRRQAAVFFSTGIAIFIYTIVVVLSSTNQCASHPHCKVPSYRWNLGAHTCTCTVFVDRKTSASTFDEWENPVDMTRNLAAVAASGDLKVVQIVNRRLETLPVELRECTGLEQLILIYTKTVSIPDWASEFTSLEYIHIEGDFTSTTLVRLPPNLFSNMPHLAFLHLGSLPNLRSVPDFTSLRKLKYISLALLRSVPVLPSFHSLSRLQQLAIIDANHGTSLPSFQNIHRLTAFSVVGLNPFCCNGFITGTCNLTRPSCQSPGVECSPDRIESTDLSKLTVAAGGSFCGDGLAFNLTTGIATVATTDKVCAGVKYKQCQNAGIPGMCYSSGYMVVKCETVPSYQTMRRLQVQRRVGDPCDPIVESWLGCRDK